MNGWALLAMATLAGLAWTETPMQRGKATEHESADMRALITRIAREHGVPAQVALAFAWLESRFNPRAEGDLQWPFKRPDKYRELVLEAPRFAHNDFRGDPTRWHSYGLFQLLAPYHVTGAEDPRILLDPEVNATRAMRTLRALLKKHEGDAARARLDFAGASKLSASTQATLRARLRAALERFEGIA